MMSSVGPERVNNSTAQNCQGGAKTTIRIDISKLLATAIRRTPLERYSNDDPAPCPSSPHADQQSRGLCERRVLRKTAFDPKLCPENNPRNAFMLYAAPPFDGNYATQAAFLKAIEAMAGNIVKTSPLQRPGRARTNCLLIESLRNTLFSSNLITGI